MEDDYAIERKIEPLLPFALQEFKESDRILLIKIIW
jgi:hypothetical protein